METPKLYYYLSFATIILTFTTGIGVFASLVLLFLIQSKKQKLSNKYLIGTENSLETLRKARKINIINLIINAVIIGLGVILIILFLVYDTMNPGSRLFGA